MSGYAEMDAAIVALLSSGPLSWMRVHMQMVKAFPALFVAAKEDWRVTDGRLQSLRKRGLIQPIRVGREPVWSLKE